MEKYYFNHVKVDEFFPGYSDGLFAVLGAYTIRALAKGHVQICDDNSREITVTDLYFYVHDLFQFEGDQILGYWSKTYLDFTEALIEERWQHMYYVLLNNERFRSFREKYKRGGDFLVLSQKMHVKEFVQQSFKDKDIL